MIIHFLQREYLKQFNFKIKSHEQARGEVGGQRICAHTVLRLFRNHSIQFWGTCCFTFYPTSVLMNRIFIYSHEVVRPKLNRSQSTQTPWSHTIHIEVYHMPQLTFVKTVEKNKTPFIDLRIYIYFQKHQSRHTVLSFSISLTQLF